MRAGYLLVLTMVLLAVVLVTGCASRRQAIDQPGEPVPQEPVLPVGLLPDLGRLADLPASPARRVSDLFSINGADTAAQGGSGNYVEGSALAIIPGGDDELAYAVYTLDNITQDKPVSVSFSVQPAAIIPGGDDELARFEFWIGLSNYTRFSWEWLGPFDDSSGASSLPRGASAVRKGTSVVFNLPLNTAELRERYVSASDINGESRLSYVVLVTNNGGAPIPNGVKVMTSTTETSPDYFTNKPHFVPVFDAFLDGGGAPARHPQRSLSVTKQASSAYSIVMGWQHINSIGGDDSRNETFCYQIRRQAEGSSKVDIIGLRFLGDEEGQSFRDPPEGGYSFPPEVDLPIPDPPVNGTRYTYMVKAFNADGYPSFGGPTSTPSSRMVPIDTPIDTPKDLRTDTIVDVNGVNVQGIMVSWEAVEGAVSYDLYGRYADESIPQLIGGGHPDTTVLHTHPDLQLGKLIYYSVVARGANVESQPTPEARGFAFSRADGGMQLINLGTSVIKFLYVPQGSLQLGSPDTEFGRAGNEDIYQQVDLGDFYIGETEVTNAMWNDFIAAGGYTAAANAFWSPVGLSWRTGNNITAPPYWGDASKNSDPAINPDHPVLDISYFEATAFANWVQSIWDQNPPFQAQISLPTEADWEYAAEGPTAVGEIWLYPWSELRRLDGAGAEFNNGNDGFDMARCNSVLDIGLDGFVAQTAPAGSFPLGRSWCGALDMAGNVCEWTKDNSSGTYPLPWAAGGADEFAPFSVRGGSFWDLSEQLRTSSRAQRDPDSRGGGSDPDGVGLRLMLFQNN